MRKSLSLALSSLLLASCVLFTPEAASSSASATPATYEEFHASAVEADNASSGISINERKVVGKGSVVSEEGTCTFNYTEYHVKDGDTLKVDNDRSTYTYSNEGLFILLQFSLSFKITQKAVNVTEEAGASYAVSPLTVVDGSETTRFDNYGNVSYIKDDYASSDSSVKRNYTVTITYTYGE